MVSMTLAMSPLFTLPSNYTRQGDTTRRYGVPLCRSRTHRVNVPTAAAVPSKKSKLVKTEIALHSRARWIGIRVRFNDLALRLSNMSLAEMRDTILLRCNTNFNGHLASLLIGRLLPQDFAYLTLTMERQKQEALTHGSKYPLTMMSSPRSLTSMPQSDLQQAQLSAHG